VKNFKFSAMHTGRLAATYVQNTNATFRQAV